MQIPYLIAKGRIALRLLAATGLLAGPLAPSPDRFGAASPAPDSYYMVIYAAEEDATPLTSHCFATFARMSGSGPAVELHHINWFSLRGHRSGMTCGLLEDGRLAAPEPGENRTTREALELVLRRNLRVTRFGPYEIDRELYERALRQIALLEARIPGRTVLYKALDLGYREGSEVRALNCIHAISDIIRDPAPLRTWTCYGEEAARKLVGHFDRWIKGSTGDRPEVWASIWASIWRDAEAPMADTLVRADVDRPVNLASGG